MNCPITLTPKAIEMIKASTGPTEGYILRAGIKGGGCSGFEYVLEIIENFNSRDFVFEQDGLKIAIDPMSAQYLKGVSIDYIQKNLQIGFTFNNPNAKNTCGCGQSFDA
jgi:iron-sulfur cluster assembly protein